MIDESVLEELFNGEKAVDFFVHSGICHWLVDYKYNFTLDAEKDYRAYLLKGHITQEQYESACRDFRDGVLRLTGETFGRYLDTTGGSVASYETLQSLLGKVGRLGIAGALKEAERYYLTGIPVSDEVFRAANSLVSVLPLFYVNFDRKIFMHLDADRCHEDYAYTDWYAKCGDFLFLIPDSERYWTSDGDVWKLRFLWSRDS